MEWYEIFLFIIFIVIICGNVVLNIFFYKKNKKLILSNNKSFSNVNLSFSNDIEFLHYLLEYEYKVHYMFFVSPLKVSKGVINDAKFQELTKTISESIFELLSDVYKEKLQIYFTKDGLDKYIVEYIYRKLAEDSITMNLNLIKK